mgnify:CR=1 FL=1
MGKEITVKQALIEFYNKPLEKITKQEKNSFYSMVFPCYKMDLSEEEKNQVRNCYE